MATDRFTIRKPDDFHIHLRQEDLLREVAPFTSAAFARAMVMPNISPPVRNAAGLKSYREDILEAAGEGFTPLMTFKLMPNMDPELLSPLKKAGAIAGKYYPAGATTNSQDAVSHWEQCRGMLEAMEDQGMVLSIHGEDPLAPALEREQAFLPVLDEIRQAFPRLPMVVEHLSSAEGVRWVREQDDRVGATITLHHLLFTMEDIIGGPLRPHLFCRPLPKTKGDRSALRELVLSDFHRVFFGSDSAPHPRRKKESAGGAAGAFTAPVLMPLLTGFFEKQGQLNLLEDFVSTKGARFYGLPLNEGTLVMERRERQVPQACGKDEVVPIWAGRTLEWSIGK